MYLPKGNIIYDNQAKSREQTIKNTKQTGNWHIHIFH